MNTPEHFQIWKQMCGIKLTSRTKFCFCKNIVRMSEFRLALKMQNVTLTKQATSLCDCSIYPFVMAKT